MVLYTVYGYEGETGEFSKDMFSSFDKNEAEKFAKGARFLAKTEIRAEEID